MVIRLTLFVGLLVGSTALVFGAQLVPPASHAQSDDLFCNLSSDSNAGIYQEPRPDSWRVGAVDPTGIYPVRARTETTDGTWYQVALANGQTGWVAATMSTIGGDDCDDLPTVTTTFSLAPTQAPAATLSSTEGSGESSTETSTENSAENSTENDTENGCPADFAGYLPPRLSIGMEGNVDGSVFAVIRDAPSNAAESRGRLWPDTGFTVEAGPVCADGLVWWQVRTNEVTAWSVEGSPTTDLYFLVPRQPTVWVNAASPPITPENAADLRLSARLDSDVATILIATSTDQVAIANADNAVQFYAYPSGDPLPDLNAALLPIVAQDPVTALGYDRYGDFLLVGHASGALTIVETTQGIISPITTRHTTPIVGFSLDSTNSRLLSISADGAALWDLTTFDAVNATLDTQWHIPPPQGRAIEAGVLTPDGTPILLTEGGLAVLDRTAGEMVGDFVDVGTEAPSLLRPAPLSLGVADGVVFTNTTEVGRYSVSTGRAGITPLVGLPRAIAISPDGTLLALGGQNTVQIFALPAATQVGGFSIEQTRALQFAPDGRALIAVGFTGTSFWAIQ